MWHERPANTSAIAPAARSRKAFSSIAKIAATVGKMHNSFAGSFAGLLAHGPRI
jgi:hypothetical protein